MQDHMDYEAPHLTGWFHVQVQHSRKLADKKPFDFDVSHSDPWLIVLLLAGKTASVVFEGGRKIGRIVAQKCSFNAPHKPYLAQGMFGADHVSGHRKDFLDGNPFPLLLPFWA